MNISKTLWLNVRGKLRQRVRRYLKNF